MAEGGAEAEELRAAEEAAEEPAPARRVHPVTEALAQQVAAGLGAEWKRLASRLGFQSDEVSRWRGEGYSRGAGTGRTVIWQGRRDWQLT